MPRSGPHFLGWLGRERPRAVLIATCRSRRGGGCFGAAGKEQIEILAQAVRAGCRWCDVEIETAETYCRARTAARSFSRARDGLPSRFSQDAAKSCGHRPRNLRRAGGHAVKIAAQCHSISDSVRICELARGRRDVVAIPMGEIGLAGRVLSLRAGSALAYAAVEQATAPGQLSLDAMEHLYRAARDHAPDARLRRDRQPDRPFAFAVAA